MGENTNKGNRGRPNELLRRERNLRGWSLKDVAAKIGCPDVRLVRRWERGDVFPGPDYRQKLCALYGKNAEELGLLKELYSKVSQGPSASSPFLANESSSPPSPTSSDENRRRFLARLRALYADVQEQSSRGVALIALNFHTKPAAIAHPASRMFRHLNQTEQALPPGTSIQHVYDKADGELLILGNPGAGKSTLLLHLAQELLARAECDEQQRLPAIFNLSSWTSKRQAFALWLVEELFINYQVPRRLGQHWVQTGQLLLLLDGLDEVEVSARGACINAINTYRLEYPGPLVVCSRHFSQQQQLVLRDAIDIQPLTQEQIDEYFEAAGPSLVGVRTVLQMNPVLRELVSSPLMLNVMILAYGSSSVAVPPQTGTLEEQQQQIFASYVERQLYEDHHNAPPQGLVQQFLHHHRVSFYAPHQTRRWLVWLAQQLKQHNQTDFYLERLQIDWYSDRPFYQHLLSTSTGFLIAIFGWIVYSIFFWYKFGLVGIYTDAAYISLFFTFIYVLVNSMLLPRLGRWKQRVRRTSGRVQLRWWRSLLYSLITLLDTRWGYGFLIGVPVASLVGFLMWRNLGFIDGLAYGFANILMLSIEFVVFDRFSTEVKPVEIVVWSWASVWRNLKISIPASLSFAFLMGILFTIDSEFGLKDGIPIGLLYGVGFFLATNAIFWGLSQERLKKQDVDRPNQGIRRSAKNCLLFGTATLCLSGLLFWLILFLFGRPLEGIYYGALAGAIFGGIIALWGGGFACFQHYLVRILLRKAGYIPWNYATFLDYAVEHILLRRVGGGYIFVHQLLLDYFASLAL